MKECLECKNEIDEADIICSHCGYEVAVECKECGAVYDKRQDSCPKCGCPSNDKNEVTLQIIKKSNENGKLLSYCMIVVALILMIISYTRVNNEEYDFYKEHYVECEAGYDDARDMANSYSSGFFRSSYNTIANSYQEMMDDDMKEINSYRIQAGVILGTGIVLLCIGIKRVKRS